MAYDGQPVEETAFPVIDRLEVLPYFSSYWQWEEHLRDCSHCLEVMNTGSGEIEDLCPEGQIVGQASRSDVDQQHESAKWS